MASNLHWVSGPWPGKLALAARPRGGDWLKDEILDWQRAGIKQVISLLMPDEEQELGLREEGSEVKRQGMEFVSFPIMDRQVPSSQSELAAILERLDAKLVAGSKVVVHCRQGIGRSGLLTACLLATKGLTPQAAIRAVSDARGLAIPDTREQREWIDRYSAFLATPK